MIAVEILTAVLAVIAVVLLMADMVQRSGVRRQPMLRGELVTVQTCKPDDQTIHGLCVGDYHDRLRLVDAHYVLPTGARRIPDSVTIFKRQISWLQEHGEPSAGGARRHEAG